MAAAQCRSSKCTAERKGFRRELDSWRHKLIHCVGFESILEGVYGSLLLKDLNIFDDCEPDDVDDWSVDASCSFCNLQLDKLNDHVPAAASPLSSPSDDTPSQAPPLSDSCQSAHRFLHAVFHRKDDPASCEPSIPLAAQQLMTKMILQFAKEYAGKNGFSTGTDPESPLLDCPDPDAPLDLTVTRNQENHVREPKPDGVLDLSKRNSAGSATSSPTNHKASGFLLPMDTDHTQQETKDSGMPEARSGWNPALEAVLFSLCPAHSSLLQRILITYHKYRLSLPFSHRRLTQADPNCHHHLIAKPQDNARPSPLPFPDRKAPNSTLQMPFSDCNNQNHRGAPCLSRDCKPHSSASPFPFSGCTSQAAQGSGCCCGPPCRVAAYPVGPASSCLKGLHCLPCQSLTMGHINKVVCSFTCSPSLSSSPSLCSTSTLCPTPSVYPTSTVCCSPHPCPCYSHHAYITQVRHAMEEGVGGGDPQCPVLQREQTRSPSPPPLSPIPFDINAKAEDKPPSLLPHEKEDIDRSLFLMVTDDQGDVASQKEADVDMANTEESKCKTPERSPAEQNQSGSSLQDVMERFSEKLETIKPLEKDQTLSSSSANQSLGSQADAHLSEIITTVLHSGNDSDYNLSELFHRHDDNEARSPQTRSRRRQEALASPDQSSTWRQSLQIKRELARLDQSLCKRKLSLGKSGRSKDCRGVTSPPSRSSPETTPVKEEEDRVIETVREEEERDGVMNGGGIETVTEGERDRVTEEGIKDGGMMETVTEGEKDGVKEEGRIIETVTEGERDRVTEEGIKEKGMMETLTEGEGDRVTQEGIKEGERMAIETDGERDRVTEEGIKERLTEVSFDGYKLTEREEVDKVTEEGDEDRMTEETEERKEEERVETPDTSDNQTSSLPPTEPQSCSPEAGRTEEETPACSSACDDSSGLSEKTEDTPGTLSCSNGSVFAIGRGGHHHRRVRGNRKTRLLSETASSSEAGRSRRNIVPPQRFSSYVTEPRKMFFAACFSETIFSQRTPKVLIANHTEALSSGTETTDGDASETREESLQSVPELVKQEKDDGACESTPGDLPGSPNTESESQNQVTQVTVAAAEQSPPKHTSQNRTDDRDIAAKPYGRLRSSPAKVQDRKPATRKPKRPSKPRGTGVSENTASSVESHSHFQYTSPIKLMFVSPVFGEEGVKYTLRAAASGPSWQGEETFDPCEESSWAGTPEKTRTPTTEATASPPKLGVSREGEVSPPKQSVETDTQRSPVALNGGVEKQDGPPFHETTPPKRRGRPKKLGPQLEKRAKRPIGRPPKQKGLDQTCVPGKRGSNAVNENTSAPGRDEEEPANKSLKITVVYGRSRRSKRMVSEDCARLQTAQHEAPLAETGDDHSDKNNLLKNSRVSVEPLDNVPKEETEDLNFVRPVKDRKFAPHSSSNIKCQKLRRPGRPGRPAKVKISGISVTVTTVSPRQRKIHMNKDNRGLPDKFRRRKALLPEFQPSKEPRTISVEPSNDSVQTERTKDLKQERREGQTPQIPVRHSVRVRKPSVYLLHSVATSRSFSHSTALLRRSRQLLLNRASTQRRQEEAQGGEDTPGDKTQLPGLEKKSKGRRVCQDLSQVAGVSVDSIFPPSEVLRWWPVSAEEENLNQELARRIRLVSDTWVSDAIENQGGKSLKPRVSVRTNGSSTKKPESSSMVRMLFDCPSSKPRSCSMDQLCSWFMQTTETQSLSITKNSSSRNPYELLHYPRAVSRGHISPSPQAERLRKHVKKFAKTIPKSPAQHRQAQQRMWRRNKLNAKRRLFSVSLASGRVHHQGTPLWRGRRLGRYRSTLLRAKFKFLTRSERDKWPKRRGNNLMVLMRRLHAFRLAEQVKSTLQPGEEHMSTPPARAFNLFNSSDNNQTSNPAQLTEDPMNVPKEQRLSSKAWSPESLKECRVFLKKINSPDTESTPEEEWDICRVTLDDGSPSAYRPNGRVVEERVSEEEDKAVKTERRKRRRRKKKSAPKNESGCFPLIDFAVQDCVRVGKRKSKWKSPGKVFSESQTPPPAKVTRQSRGRGLTGPRWSDFVLGN